MKAIPPLFLLAYFCATASATLIIDVAPVGNLGNANDPATGNLYGGVSYVYDIGKYEVTVGQYTAFLNAVASTDTYNLYNPSMGSDPKVAGISRSCTFGCTYSVEGSPNHPVTYVSWGDAARFVNWLSNGQPIGAQDSTTTEDGTYALNGAITDTALSAVSRKAGATWFIPSENEWYKAAYHQPAEQGGDADDYWNYPMRTNTLPYSDQPPGATPDNSRVGNFYVDDGVANGYDDGYAVTGSTMFDFNQNYLTDVGAYSSSPSYYGTFDQGGNVFEWIETGDAFERGLRGGLWDGPPEEFLSASYQISVPPTVEVNGYARGFRVARIAIPEPSTLLLTLVLGVVGASQRRRPPYSGSEFFLVGAMNGDQDLGRDVRRHRSHPLPAP